LFDINFPFPVVSISFSKHAGKSTVENKTLEKTIERWAAVQRRFFVQSSHLAFSCQHSAVSPETEHLSIAQDVRDTRKELMQRKKKIGYSTINESWFPKLELFWNPERKRRIAIAMRFLKSNHESGREAWGYLDWFGFSF
jgi:hypothetical protein